MLRVMTMNSLVAAIKHRIHVGSFFTDALIAFIAIWIIIGLVRFAMLVF